MEYPLPKLRTMFGIAADVKDDDLLKAFREADLLDIKHQIKAVYSSVPDEYKNDTNDLSGIDTIICYYAFARYLQSSEQTSTATGFKVQNYLGAFAIPDGSKGKRYEAEKGKADLLIVDLIALMEKDGFIKSECNSQRVESRICLIK